MIPGFARIVRQDITCIQNYINSSRRDDEETEKKVAIAASRMLTVLGMAFAVLSIFPAFTAKTGGQALSRLVSAVVMYVLNHDFFILAVNHQRGLLGQGLAIARSVASGVRDLFEEKEGVAPRHPLTEGTLLRPVWDVVIDLLGKK